MEALARRVVSLLDYEPELVESRDARQRELARRALRARVVELEPGRTENEGWSAGIELPALGLLLLDGCLVRESPAGVRTALEVLAPGDLLRPWDQPPLEEASPPRWRALSRCSLALLDGSFARRTAHLPEVAELLLSRAMLRNRRAVLMLAIRTLPRVEDRVLAVLWLLADRLGRVGPPGITVELPLRQADLGALAGARRPTVNITLKALRDQGLVRSWTSRAFVLAPGVGELVAGRLWGKESAR